MQEHNTGSEFSLGPGLWVLLQKAQYFGRVVCIRCGSSLISQTLRSSGAVLCRPFASVCGLLNHGCRQSNIIMPSKYVRDDGHSKKRTKSDVASRNTTYRYSDGADVQRCLQTSTNDGLVDGEKIALRRRPTQTFSSCSPHRTSQPTYNKIRGRTNSA